MRASAEAERSPELSFHIASCPACASWLIEESFVREGLRALPWPVVDSDALAQRVASAVDAPSGTRRAPTGPTPAPRGVGPESIAHGRPWAAFLVALAVTACAALIVLMRPSDGPRRAEPSNVRPSPTATHAATATAPGPAPTRVGGGRLPVVFGQVSRPVAIDVSANWMIEVKSPCRDVHLDLGDGSGRSLTCPDPPPMASMAFPYPAFDGSAAWRITHTYTSAGVYVPQLRMTLGDGSELIQSQAQLLIARSRPAGAPGQRGVLRWSALALLLVTIAFTLRRARNRRARDLGFVLAAALALAVLMAVLSTALPSPAKRLTPYLDALIGVTGLDPLDPAWPVADYRVLGGRRHDGYSRVRVALRYDNDRVRVYDVPEDHRNVTVLGGATILRDGLGRLRAEHRELPELPFADLGRDGVALGEPVRVAPDAAFDAGPRAWMDAMCLAGGNLLASPDGRWVLAAHPTSGGLAALDLLPVGAGPGVRLTNAAAAYAWSRDGRSVTTVESYGQAALGVHAYERSGEAWIRRDRTPLHGLSDAGRDVAGSALDVSLGDALAALPDGAEACAAPSVSSWLGSEPRDWDEIERSLDRARQPGDCPKLPLVRADRTGARLAYSCPYGLCIVGAEAPREYEVPGRFQDAVWSPDGQFLALVEQQGPTGRRPDPAAGDRRRWLRVITADGRLVARTMVAPEGSVGPVTWSRYGDRLYMTTCPYDGRRIVTVEATSGHALDLSKPRWDAWATYSAAHDALFVSNGRGGLWRVPVAETSD